MALSSLLGRLRSPRRLAVSPPYLPCCLASVKVVHICFSEKHPYCHTCLPITTLSCGGMAYDLDSLAVVIDRHLRTTPGLSLQQLAQRLNIERHSIERSVRQARGLTFRQLRNNIMLDEARRMLAEYPYSTVKEIAFRLGYKSPSAFGRFIKDASGTSPTAVRLNKRNGHTG